MVSSRRGFLGLLGAVGGAGLAGCTTRDVWSDDLSVATDSPTAPGGRDAWPTFQRDRRNSGHAPTTGPTEDVSEEWRRADLGSDAAVVDGTVYVGSTDKVVHALDARDGTERWRFRTERWVYSTPAVVDGTVYVSTVGPSTGRVYALSAPDGVEQWRYGTDRPAPPVVVDGTVYLCSGHSVAALSAADGSERWTVEMGWLESSPAVADGTVYAGTGSRPTRRIPGCYAREGCYETATETPDQNSVMALSAADGAVEWHAKIGSWVGPSPTVADGTVYAVSDELYALSAIDGAEQWSVEYGIDLSGPVGDMNSPAIADGTVYVAGGRTVAAFSAVDGAEKWRYDLPHGSRDRPEFEAPVVADDTVYAVGVTKPGRMRGTVHALSAADGTERWRFEVDMALPPPAVVDGTLHFGRLALG